MPKQPRRKQRRKRRRLKSPSKLKLHRSSGGPPLRLRRRGGAFVLAVLDPFQGPTGPYNFRKDTSHLILKALSSRGHLIFYTDPFSLIARGKTVWARGCRAAVLESEPYFRLEKTETLDLAAFDLILMRKDPPVDQTYLYATQLLDIVSDRIPTINHPRALQKWNEKLSILNFPRWIPETLVTSHKDEIRHFAERQDGPIVVKSLETFGGKGVWRLMRNHPAFEPTIDGITRGGMAPIMAQPYLQKVEEGEKRIFLLEDRPIGAILKIPPRGGFLTNPDLGGQITTTKLDAREKKIALEVGTFLKKEGVFFAGLDLIDGNLTEINITSPGLVWEWNEVDNRRHEEEIAERIEKKFL